MQSINEENDSADDSISPNNKMKAKRSSTNLRFQFSPNIEVDNEFVHNDGQAKQNRNQAKFNDNIYLTVNKQNHKKHSPLFDSSSASKSKSRNRAYKKSTTLRAKVGLYVAKKWFLISDSYRK